MSWATILTFLTGGISALFKALFSRLLGKDPKDQLIEERGHDVAVAQKQAAIVADRSRPDGLGSLHSGDF